MSLPRLAMTSTARRAALLAVGLAVAVAPAVAAPMIIGPRATGVNVPVGTGGQDANWMVEAWPVDAPLPPPTPYAAWVFSGTGSTNNVPPPWFPGPPTGHSNPRVYGARWIGLQNNDATSVLPDSFGATVGTYHTVYSTTFTSSAAGSVSLGLLAAADNAVTFFVNGSVTGKTTNYPTISGGTQLGNRIQGLSKLQVVEGVVPVQAGTNTLYAVVEDRFGPTLTYGYTGLIVVPEPSTYASAAIAAVGLGLGSFARRRRASRVLTA